MELYGMNDNTAHRRIEFIYMPCLTYKFMTNRTQEVTCKGTMQDYAPIKVETEKYLKNAELAIIYN